MIDQKLITDNYISIQFWSSKITQFISVSLMDTSMYFVQTIDYELLYIWKEIWTLGVVKGCIVMKGEFEGGVEWKSEYNPSITLYVSDILPFSFDLSGTDSALYPYDPEQGYFKNFWFPTTNLYPYFLFPPTSRPHHRLPAPHGTAHTVGTITLRTHAASGTTQIDANANQAITIHKAYANNSFHKYQGFTAITGITAHAIPTSAYDLYPCEIF